MTQPLPQASTASGTAQRLARSSYTIPVAPPFRLDLTVSALRRLPTNTIDVLTVDGRVLSGFLFDQDTEIVVLRGVDAQNVSIPRADIDEMARAPKSLMPEGILSALSDQEIRDLIAYLQSEGQP